MLVLYRFTSSAVLSVGSEAHVRVMLHQQMSAVVALQPRAPAPPRILSALRDLSLLQGSACVLFLFSSTVLYCTARF